MHQKPSTLNMSLLLAIVLLFSTQVAWSSAALSLEVGTTQETSDWSEQHLNFEGSLWYQWDQMIFFGLSGGVQQYGEDKYYPALGSALVRLPMGRTLLPFATGQWGYLFGPEHQFTWKLGGGLDLKLGRDSSLILSSGYQQFSLDDWNSQVYIRGGILLEF